MMAFPYTYPNYGSFSPTPAYIPQSYPNTAPISAQTPTGGVNGQPGYLCRPVTSRLEAEAVQIDFLGPGTIMPDLGHGVIYLKRFNPNTGSSDFIVFTAEQPAAEPAPVQFATIDDINALRAEIDNLRKAVKTDDE